MINNTNNYHSFLNTNSAATSSQPEVEQLTINNKRAEAPRVADEINQNASLFLSSKAQKISVLSEEFFSQGGPDFNDIESLKTRVYQLGLISKEEYANLTHTELSDEERDAISELSSQSIAKYVGGFLERLDESNAGKDEAATQVDTPQESNALTALKTALSSAQTIIADVDTAKSQANFKETLTSSMSIIRETINTRAFDAMPIDDQVGLTHVYQTLELVDKISPQRLTNDKLNKYIEVSLR